MDSESQAALTRTIASTATLKLAELHTHSLFYTPIEERFERIIRVARRALRVPVAAVTLLNTEKQWFKAVAGWSVNELPVDHSLCAHTLDRMTLTVIPDTLAEPQFAHHPLVEQRPKIRFYAGYPLIDGSKVPAGTFFVVDVKPREFNDGDQECFLDLAMMAQMELLNDGLANAQGEFIARLGLARREAMIDPLTRLWNRRGTAVFMKNAIENADKTNTELAIGMLDIDRFKQANDLYGHQTGDEALRKVAQVLTSILRSTDIVCRYGGDEFIVILPDMNAKVASDTLNRVRDTIQATPIKTRSGTIPITVSIGCAIRKPGDPTETEALIDAADELLTQSKAGGRNRMRMAG